MVDQISTFQTPLSLEVKPYLKAVVQYTNPEDETKTVTFYIPGEGHKLEFNYRGEVYKVVEKDSEGFPFVVKRNPNGVYQLVKRYDNIDALKNDLVDVFGQDPITHAEILP